MIQFSWASFGFCNEASELRLQNIVIATIVLLKHHEMHMC